ncbi:MAG: S41 family peptidase [Gammaproteobacteria bacterium]|nr:S41 family peptidase [Gammaproteobacteria bacterium]
MHWSYKILLTTGLIHLSLASHSLTTPAQGVETTPNEQISVEEIQRFSNTLNLIKRYYVTPTNDKELFDNAIRGMLTGLDPHSTYLDEKDFKELQASTNGEFGGLGIEVTMEHGAVKVITALVDTPAFKAGIKPGDYIIKLDEKAVQGLELKDAVNLMRGKPGSPISLTIVRMGAQKPMTFNLLRQIIEVKSVKSELLDNQYGYIRLTQFQASTDTDMEKAISELKQKANGHLKGLVLDLRNNPGGLLDSAIQISGSFLGKGSKEHPEVIVYTKGRLPGSEFTAISQSDDLLNKAPMVVLINNGSASAAEIVAGALKDNQRAIIIGTRSFGKGSVQTVLPLDADRGIKLTTALYYTPKGTSIQAQGIMPDIIVEEVKIEANPTGPNDKNIIQALKLSEATLNKHIVINNAANVNDNATVKDDKRLLKEDYQLYTALTILKSLALSSTEKKDNHQLPMSFANAAASSQK